MEVWMLVSFAEGMRVKCRRCVVLSTRAMLKSGWGDGQFGMIC